MKSLLTLVGIIGLLGSAAPVFAQGSAAPTAAPTTSAAPATPRRPLGERKRIAVIPFDFGSIKHWWGNDDWDIGRDMADLLKVELVNSGVYQVLERKMLDQILGEQAISQAGLVDPRSMVQVGRLMGVNAVIVGTVTQFGFDERTSDGFLGLGRTRDLRAVVALNVRLVDPNTGEVLGAVVARGEEMGRARPGGKAKQGGVSMSACTFENTFMTGAVKKCVDQMVAELVKAEPRIRTVRPEVKGKVADFDGSTVIFNIGSTHGLTVGDAIVVERVTRQVKDPDTGVVIRDVTEAIGRVVITKVEPLSACGRWEGTGEPKTGDIARRPESGRRPDAATPLPAPAPQVP
jgi:curli biogenesis system outer membrane secretion channel CsgG